LPQSQSENRSFFDFFIDLFRVFRGKTLKTLSTKYKKKETKKEIKGHLINFSDGLQSKLKPTTTE